MRYLIQFITKSSLKRFFLSRLFFLCFTLLFVLTGLLSWYFDYHYIITIQSVIVLFSIILAVILVTWTEEFTSMPAERFMNVLTGFGTKGEDAVFDEQGVPLVSLRKIGEIHYNPVRVAMAGFDYYEEWKKSGEESVIQKMYHCTDSLMENMLMKKSGDKSFAVWEYHYPWAELSPPWVSGLAQGVCVQLFSIAYECSKNTKYLEAAQMTFNAFAVEVKDGGVTYKDSPDEWWYEEYAKAGCVESRVLNGMIYALAGIHDYQRISKDSLAQEAFDRGVRSLLKRLNDTGWWTYYDSCGLIASKSYHKVHINQMEQMYDLTGIEEFKKTAVRWRKYKAPFFIREFIRQKPGWHDLVVLFLNMGFVFIVIEVLYIAWKYFLSFH